MENESTKWLYEQLNNKGYNVGKDIAEFDNLMQTNEQSRKWAYETANREGFNVGKDIDEFTSLVAPVTSSPTPAATSPAGATAQSVANAGMPSPAGNPVARSAVPASSAQEADTASQGWTPSLQERLAASHAMNMRQDDMNQTVREGEERMGRLAEQFTAEGRNNREAKKLQAQLAGAPTKLFGIAGVSATEADKTGEAETTPEAARKPAVASPEPYGVEYVDGKPVTRWLMPDGRITTNLAEAGTMEAAAQQTRLHGLFDKRMKQNGLTAEEQSTVDAIAGGHNMDPDKRQEIKRYMEQNGLDPANKEHIKWFVTGDERNILVNRLQKAEEKVKRLLYQREQERAKADDEADFLTKLGRNMREGIQNQHPVQQYNKPQIDRDIEAAQAEVLSISRAISTYDSNVKASGKGFFGKMLQGLGDAFGDVNTYTMGVVDASVNKSIRDADATSDYGRSLIQAAQIGQELVASSTDPGGWYHGSRFVGSMMFDPVMYMSLGSGSLLKQGFTRAAVGIASRGAAKNLTKEVGERFVNQFLAGRLGSAAAFGAGNFAVFEGLGDMRQQFVDGGWTDSNGKFHDGFSFSHAMGRGARGLMLGTAMGLWGAGTGNVFSKAIKATDHIAGKGALYAARVPVSLVGEGTIFAMPDIIEFHTMDDKQFDKLYAAKFGYADETDDAKRNSARDAARNSLSWDAWSESQATIFAMNISGKAIHAAQAGGMRAIVSNVGKTLAELRGVDEREHRSFKERLSQMMDRSPFDVVLTREERQELRRAGYGKLAELFVRDAEAAPADGTAERVEAERIGEFDGIDGYSVMERFMKDGKVSEAVRTKLYFVLTGRMLPMSTVMGYTTTPLEGGRIIVNSVNARGEVVTSRTFDNGKAAQAEMDRIERQSELNTVDVGEQYASDRVASQLREAAFQEVARRHGRVEHAEGIRKAYEQATRDLADPEKAKELGTDTIALVEEIDTYMEEHVEEYSGATPEAIRNGINRAYDVDIDKALRKERSHRTEAESEAITAYLEGLFPEELRNKQGHGPAANPDAPQLDTTDGRRGAAQAHNAGYEMVQAAQRGEAVRAARDMHGRAAEALGRREVDEVLREEFGTDETAEVLDRLPASRFDEEQKAAIAGYVTARETAKGVTDRMEADAQQQIDRENDFIDKTSHPDGYVLPAKMKKDGREVYVIEGELKLSDDGMTVMRGSDKILYLFNPKTGKVETCSPKEIDRIDGATPVDKARAEAERLIREQLEIDMLALEREPQADTTSDKPAAAAASAEEDAPAMTTQAAAAAAAPVNPAVINYNHGDSFQLTVAGSDKPQHAAVVDRDGDKVTIWTPLPVNETSKKSDASSGYITDMQRDELDKLVLRDEQGMAAGYLPAENAAASDTSVVEERGNNGAEQIPVITEGHDKGDIETVPKTPETVLNPTENAAPAAKTVPEAVPNVESGQQTALSRIPVNEQGEPMFEAVDKETGWDGLVEAMENEEDAQAWAEGMIANSNKEVKAAEKELKSIVPSGDIAAFKEARRKARATFSRAQEQVARWKAIAGVTAEREQARAVAEAERVKAEQEAKALIARQEKEAEQAWREQLQKLDGKVRETADIVREVPEAVEILQHSEPQDIHEAAAFVLSTNKVLPQDDGVKRGFRTVTGGGAGEQRKLFGLFARAENGGRSIESLAEDEMQQVCESYGIPYDNAEALNALIDVIQQSHTVGDIRGYIANNRIRQAQEYYDQWVEHMSRQEETMYHERYHMSRQEYDAYIEQLESEYAGIDEETLRAVDNMFAEYRVNELNNERYGRETERNEADGGRSIEVLSGPSADNAGRGEKPAGTESGTVRGQGGREYDPTSEGTPAPVVTPSPETGDSPVRTAVAAAEALVDTNPTEAQKKAGNYKMGHVKVDGLDITIENPKGNVRRGTDGNGKSWETEMNNTYGYIKGTTGVDGDHIDVFLSDTPEEGDVFVVDQYNTDGTFDEHKVMYGFSSATEAEAAYLSNYSADWADGHKIVITGVTKEEFHKWLGASSRKTKPFAEYKGVKPIEDNSIVGRSLSEQEATDLIAQMESNAEVAPAIELTPDNWIAQFGEDGTVDTPIGIVKMGANQLLKLYSLKRAEYFGMIHPTLNSPDVILEEADPKEGSERDSKYLFIKTFVKSDGTRIVHFESVTVKKDGMEVSISSHEIKDKSLKNKMQNDIVLHLDEKLSPSSEMRLTETPSESEGPDLVPTSDNVSSDGKVNTLLANNQISKDAKRLSVDESADKQRADDESSTDATPQFSVGKTTEDRVGTAEAYDVAAGLVKSAGLDVVEVSNAEALAILGNKKSPDTGKATQMSAEVPAISSDDVANIQQNLVIFKDNLDKNLPASKNHSSRAFRGQLAETLGIPERGQSSRYVRIESKSGKVVTLRISNHNSKVSNFDANGEAEGISIIISRDSNRGMTNDGEAHVVEYFYSDKALNNAESNPYRDIVEGIEQMLYSGEYTDKTGLAQVEEVNAEWPKLSAGSNPSDSDLKAFDETYLKAVEAGDMDSAQRMVEEAAERAGYSADSDYQGTSAFNGAAPFNGYGWSKEERRELWDKDEFEGDWTLGDQIDGMDNGDLEFRLFDSRGERSLSEFGRESARNLREAYRNPNRKITVYRSVPSDVKERSLRDGDWVTPSRSYAKDNAAVHGWGRKYRIIEQEIDVDELWWDGNDINEWGYDSGSNMGYRNTKNNRKLLDAVTYDDKGNIIPLSKRFDSRKSDVRYLKTPSGTVYGWTVDGKVYLNRDAMNPETPIHEYTHLWDDMVKKENPALWNRGKELMKQLPLWDEVRNDPNYADIRDDEDAVASEVHSRLTGERGAKVLGDMIAKSKGKDIVEQAKVFSLVERVKEWLRDMFKDLKATLSKWSGKELADLAVDDFVNLTLRDLAEGVNPKQDTDKKADRAARFEIRNEEEGIEFRTPQEGIAYHNARSVQPWVDKLDRLLYKRNEQGRKAEHPETQVTTGPLSRLDFIEDQYGQGGLTGDMNRLNRSVGTIRDSQGRLISSRQREKADGALRIIARRRADLLKDRPLYSRTAQAEIDKELADLEYMALYYQRMADGEDVERTMTNRVEHQRMLHTAREVAAALGEEVVLYEAPGDIQDENPGRRQRKQRSFGWYNPNDGTIHINVGRHRDARDIVRTVMHEIVGHKTIEQIFGPERFARFIDELWNHAAQEVRAKIASKISRNGWDYREATKEYLGEIAEEVHDKGYDSLDAEKKSLWQRVKSKVEDFINRILEGRNIPLRVKLTEQDLSYMMWKLFKHKQRKAAGKPAEGDIFDKAEEIVRREEWKKSQDSMEIVAREESATISRIDDKIGAEMQSAFGPEAGLHFRDGESIEEQTLKLSVMLAERHAGDIAVRDAAVEALGKKIGKIRKAMSTQHTYDYNTVRSLGAVADMLISSGSFLPEGPAEVKQLYGIMKRGIGHTYTDKNGVEHTVQSSKDFDNAVEGLMDLFVSNQLKLAGKFLDDVMKIRGSKVNARGVEVMGQLDVEGQIMVRGMKEYMNMDLQTIRDRRDTLDEVIVNGNDAASMNAAAERMGLDLAEQYITEVAERKAQERLMRDELRDIKEQWNPSMDADARKAYIEQKKALRESIRKIRIERAEAMRQFASQIGNELRNSVERVNAFREREKERIQEIWHNANSDMTGRPFNEHGTDKPKGFAAKLSNSWLARLLMAPTATFEQIMRVFGKKSIDGQGYLFDRFVRGWQTCRDKEWTSTQEVESQLNRKASEILGKKKARWSDLYDLTRKSGGMCKWWDGGEPREHKVTQGNLMYMYMVNKMTDGQVKLRRMGISDSKMAEIEQALDPRLKAVADWLQGELLPALRDRYNEVHMRMFGAPMAEIDDYFPLKILANARLEEIEIAGTVGGKDLPKTMTGAIIKRRFNNYALDILNSDAVSIALDHIREMETWAAFAEYRRDLSTLLSYKRFRNQVKNMTTIYGSGEKLWDKFYDLSLLVGGAYKPKTSEFDKVVVNITKLVTGACIAWRINTALKQLLSFPGFTPDASRTRLMYNMTPWRARACWKWAMENMPSFQRRWVSRKAGNDLLKDWTHDWDWTRTEFVQSVQRKGMTPNAFIDALTVAMGSEAIYHSKLKGYIKDGFSREEAHRRAVIDAEIAFNLSQQSSELPYLSLLQNNRSYISVCMTNFRNSSMSYLRQSIQSKCELINMIKNKQEMLEFETKKGVREGLTLEQAEARAKRKYRRNWTRNLIKSATFDFILPALWYYGLKGAWYAIFGNDEEQKRQYAEDSLKRGLFGFLEGFTGGGTIPDFIYSYVSGDNPQFDEETSPAMGLITDVVNLCSNGKTERAANEMINSLVAFGIGANPQVFEDVVVAGLDFFEQDEKSARDWALLFMRVIQCPQSQMDQVYFDELGMNAREAQRMSPAELAERYATYKARRTNFATMWAYDDERWEKEAKEPWRKKFNKEAKERLKGWSEKHVNEALEEYDAELDDTRKDLKELLTFPGDITERAAKATEIFASPEGKRYVLYNDLRPKLDKMIKSWLKAPSAEAAAVEAGAIIEYKATVVEMLDSWNNPEKCQAAGRRATEIVGEWYRRHQGE